MANSLRPTSALSFTNPRSLAFAVLFFFLCVFTLFSVLPKPPLHHAHTGPFKAVANLRGDSSSVKGSIVFEQSSPTSPVHITGEITNLDPRSARGFHIHQYGDTSNGCLATGGHYNPHGVTHGAPSDPSTKRHVGDLGNIHADSEGVATIDIHDSLITLAGEFSVLGRGVVVHMGTDDLGRTDHPDSLKTGNAGGRAACGVIGIVA
ncbi:hypothetical protein BOTBODRAFT_36707 [Botryobasidium botryosum FD-172 SS1]|uniref:Superoxide dismutase [Cu-Zn] n=1 Tax=Botryobasidium botryosum (strain FD-172 SS1) TaxID=930990 RepID=A0A067M5C9_BOTB1|nr:hypothetical protein BOTBODRAFT_36707 [Botryobasidium botryosum FD-172 SS1]